MAMTFTFATLENGARNLILQVVGVDAAATTAGALDGSSIGILATNVSGYTPTIHGKVKRVLYNTTNCLARLQWHQTSNAELLSLSGYGDWNMAPLYGSQASQGMTNPNGAGSTGDIDLFSSATVTAATGTGLTAAMSLIIHIAKDTQPPNQ